MAKDIKLGLKENWQQFTLLVIINAFVGGMVGMERSIIPKFAESIFNISSNTAVLSFIVAFGFSKALTNYFTGKLANRLGRRNLLLIGWLIALPVPIILINAPVWSWVVFANILLGISQGLTWSSTVVMKIDLVGEKDRGLAMGLNEFSGYLAVGLIAFFTGFIAQTYGVTPYPFFIGLSLAVMGLLTTFFFIKDTQPFAKQEAVHSNTPLLKNIFWETSFKDKTLGTVTQAGLVNNLNDGMIWGLLPIVLLQAQFSNKDIGILTAIYPSVWGIGQLMTGKLSDVYSKKAMLFWGMLLQGIVILGIPISTHFTFLVTLSALLGLGTALVYPTFLSAIAQATHPSQRAESLGAFRLWRDMGYAIGAIISGITADVLGIDYAIILIGGITILSAIIIQSRMPNTFQSTKECIEPTDVQQALLRKPF
jgi:predicted MFS family arabinose efflux permease